jgi:putative endonuclease
VEQRTDRRTLRRRSGDRAEEWAVGYLVSLGWKVIARNVRAGRHEVDMIAIEPGALPTLVFVEVRSRSGSRFGAPEESVVGRKAARMYRAAASLVVGGTPPDIRALPHLPWRVDLLSVVVDRGEPKVRHIRGVDPG